MQAAGLPGSRMGGQGSVTTTRGTTAGGQPTPRTGRGCGARPGSRRPEEDPGEGQAHTGHRVLVRAQRHARVPPQPHARSARLHTRVPQPKHATLCAHLAAM